jgi:AcrR family transcriptional regulator
LPRKAKIRPGEPGRQRIEQAALELFGERGYEGTSIADIGKLAGITKSVLYHHFDSKADLYAAVCERETAELLESVQRALSENGEGGKFRIGVDAYLRFLSERPAAWRLLLRDRPAEPSLASLYERLEQQRAEALTELLASADKRATKSAHVGLVAVAVRAFAAWWYDHPDVAREAVVGAIVSFAQTDLEAATINAAQSRSAGVSS